MKINEKLKEKKEDEITSIERTLRIVDLNIKLNRDYVLKVNDLRNVDKNVMKLLGEYIKTESFPMFLVSKYLRCLVTPNLEWCAHEFVNEVVQDGDTVDKFFERWGHIIEKLNKEWEEENGPL